MLTEVYIGEVKSEKFDYDEQGEHAYCPEIITNFEYDHDLFWDIIEESDKQIDWGWRY